MALLPSPALPSGYFHPPPAKGVPPPSLGPHRAGQFGKILPCKLDHISHPQDGAEGVLVGVEAACLHVSGCQVGKEVSPAEERSKARAGGKTGTGSLAFPARAARSGT